MIRSDCDNSCLTPGHESEIEGCGGLFRFLRDQGVLLGGACGSLVHMTHGLLGKYAEKQLCVEY